MRRGIAECGVGAAIAVIAGVLVYNILTPDSRRIIGLSVAPDWQRMKLAREGALVRVMPTLRAGDVHLIVDVLNGFDGVLNLHVDCEDLQLLESDSEFNGQEISSQQTGRGSYAISVERLNPDPMPVFEDQIAEIHALCPDAMGYTGIGKRSVTFVLNAQHVLYNGDIDFMAGAVELSDVRAAYPWVRDRAVWTKEPAETNYGLDLTVYTVDAENNYQFDIRRVDGSGTSELVLIIMSALLGVGVTLMTDGGRRIVEERGFRLFRRR